MNENISFKEKMAVKFENFKAWASSRLTRLFMWIADHPGEAAALGGSIVAGAHSVHRTMKTREERLHRERDFYDPRTGKYTRARRKLRGYELDEIEYRYKRGESYNSILRDMGLRD